MTKGPARTAGGAAEERGRRRVRQNGRSGAALGHELSGPAGAA
jgi:hypothetical protein